MCVPAWQSRGRLLTAPCGSEGESDPTETSGHFRPLAVFSQGVAQSSHDGMRHLELGRVRVR